MTSISRNMFMDTVCIAVVMQKSVRLVLRPCRMASWEIIAMPMTFWGGYKSCVHTNDVSVYFVRNFWVRKKLLLYNPLRNICINLFSFSQTFFRNLHKPFYIYFVILLWGNFYPSKNENVLPKPKISINIQWVWKKH